MRLLKSLKHYLKNNLGIETKQDVRDSICEIILLILAIATFSLLLIIFA